MSGKWIKTCVIELITLIVIVRIGIKFGFVTIKFGFVKLINQSNSS